MKKLLLSLAVVAFGSNLMCATDYVLFSKDNYASLEWTGDANGYKTTVTVNNKTFTVETIKNKASNLVKPGEQIRVYKNAQLVITSDDVVMKQVTLTASASDNAGAQSVNEPWTTSANGLVTTLKNEAGAKDVTFTASANQFRVANLVVSDEISSEDPKPVEYTKVNSIAETIALADYTKIEVAFPMTVAFVNYSNVFATDAAGDFIQIYGSNKFESNSIIPAGWKGEYVLFNKTTPEMKPESLPESTEKGNFEPKAVDADKITVDMVNSVILIKNVTFAAETPSDKNNFEGTVGSTTLSFRNNYSIAGVAAGVYDVTAVVINYKGALSLYVTNYTVPGAGVEDLVVDESTEVVYYNLQGVKVANPEKGIYIRVQGNKATKVTL